MQCFGDHRLPLCPFSFDHYVVFLINSFVFFKLFFLLYTGNDNLHELTRQGGYQLRVELADWEGNTTFVIYDTFEVGNEASNYKLTVRDYSGNGGK